VGGPGLWEAPPGSPPSQADHAADRPEVNRRQIHQRSPATRGLGLEILEPRGGGSIRRTDRRRGGGAGSVGARGLGAHGPNRLSGVVRRTSSEKGVRPEYWPVDGGQPTPISYSNWPGRLRIRLPRRWPSLPRANRHKPSRLGRSLPLRTDSGTIRGLPLPQFGRSPGWRRSPHRGYPGRPLPSSRPRLRPSNTMKG
jgi:hypothetical protein